MIFIDWEKEKVISAWRVLICKMINVEREHLCHHPVA